MLTLYKTVSGSAEPDDVFDSLEFTSIHKYRTKQECFFFLLKLLGNILKLRFSKRGRSFLLFVTEGHKSVTEGEGCSVM